MRSVHLMLLGTVVLWALNLTISRYILVHGFEPLAYSTVRYGAAVAIFVALALAIERSIRLRRADWGRAVLAAAAMVLNQVAFVYALELTTASTVGLILGATPVFAGLIGLAVGLERLHRRFWGGATVSFAGVALVATGAGGDLSGDLAGNALGVLTAATWAAYSVAITPLMERYSATRISAFVLALGWGGILLVGARQTAAQELALGWRVWLLVAVAIVGPLVLTNIMWFSVLHRIGPSRATLAANVQPFLAALFALVLLSERMTAVQVGGGLLIGVGIVLARRRRPAVVPTAE